MKFRIVLVLTILVVLFGMGSAPADSGAKQPGGLAVMYGLRAMAENRGMAAPAPAAADDGGGVLVTWQNMAQAPEARAGGTLTYVRDAAGQHNVWYIGGIVDLDGNVDGSVHKYAAQANTWTADVTTMPTPAGGHCAVAIGRTIYVIGGTDALQSAIGVQALNTDTNTWNTAFDAFPSAIATGLATHGCSVLNNLIYVYGGGDPVNLLPYPYTFTFNPAAPAGSQWTQLSFNMVHGRAAFGYATDSVNRKIYTAGGTDAYPNNIPNQLTYVEVFDPLTGWDDSPADLPAARTGAALFTYRNNTQLIIAGGGVLTPLKTSLGCALPTCSSWVSSQSMIGERTTPAYATVGPFMFVAGGIDIDLIFINFLRTVERGR